MNFIPDYMIGESFLAFAAETEGDVPTRRGKIQKLIKLLSASEDPNNFEIQCRFYDEVGIDSDTFTYEEIEYIEKEVAKWHRLGLR